MYNGTGPYIPRKMRNIALERAHDTHPGVQATKKMVNLKSWWPGDGKQVAQSWERINIDWTKTQEVDNIPDIVDAGSLLLD